jgi:hypothetical protein
MLALLQNILQSLMTPELIWVLIPLSAISIGILAVIVEPVRDAIKKKERQEARQMYERLAREKLDVIKTAVAMGFPRNELEDLDRRLAQLIGVEELKSLLDKKTPGIPLASSDLVDASLGDELAQQRQRTRQGQ